MSSMSQILDLERFPLDRPDSPFRAELVSRCRSELAANGLCNLEGFMRPMATASASDAIRPLMAREGFEHRRSHNIYFTDEVDGLPEDHPALTKCETRNRTLCADQLTGNPVLTIYEWAPLHRFLAEITGSAQLFPMADPLARVNVMAYPAGYTLNWHFDRAEFTTTLLLQAPASGGVFEYRTALRSDTDPNHEGVARLLRGEDTQVRQLSLTAGTLNVFRGFNTPHRVTPVEGGTDRMVAVFSYFDRPDVRFSDAEQRGFYGRTA